MLTSHSFTHGGTTFQVTSLLRSQLGGNETLTFTTDQLFNMRAWTLYLDGRRFAGTDSTNRFRGTLSWLNPGFTWTSGQTVDVRLTGPPPAPVFQSAVVDGTTLTLTFSHTLDAGSKPAPGAFHVTVNDARRNVASGGVAVSGNKVRLTLASAVSFGDTVKVRYTKPAAAPLTGSGGAVETFADQDVSIMGKLVGNTGQSTDGSSPIRINIAQQFTTGGNAAGYTLTSVTFPASGLVSAALAELAIESSGTNNRPGGTLGTLAITHDGSTVTGTSAEGIDLDANTTYFVVLISTQTGSTAYGRTDSDNEDAGAASGWSIGDGSLWKTNSQSIWSTSDQSWKIAIHGAINAAGGAGGNSDPPGGGPTGNSDPQGGGGPGGQSGSDEEPSTPASVSDVDVTSSPRANATYRSGETIQVTLTFSETVDVDTAGGTPRLKIDMDPAEWGEKWASYDSGSGTANLTFTHEVVEPNISTQGIAVLANTLDLNGGTIQSGDTDADLDHTGLAHDADHKVDWRPQAPDVTDVQVTSDAGSDHTYALGDVIRISVTFDEAVDVDTSGGAPRLKIDMDPAEWGEKWASYDSGSGTANLTFTHEVVEPNISTQGIAVLANTLQLNGGDIESVATDTDARLSHDGRAHDSEHKVDWRQSGGGEGGPVGTSDPPGGASGNGGGAEGGGGQSGSEEEQSDPATVSGVNVTSSPQADATYGLGETIQVTLTFSENVDVTGTPRLKIDMDPAEWGEKWAAYQSGSGTATLTFTHTVAEPNISTQGIAVLENSLDLNGGTIQSSGVAANLDHDPLAHDASHKVDWRLPLASVTDVSITSDPGADDTYGLNDVISITLTFSKTVDVDTTGGAPRLKIDMDPAEWGEKWAAYASGSGTATLTFSHTVVEPNISTQGIAVLSNTLDLNGGTIQSDGLAALLAHTGRAHDAEHKVDWNISEGSPGS